MRVIESLKELGGDDDPGLVLELIGLFLQDAPQRMHDIQSSLASGDIGTLDRAPCPCGLPSPRLKILGRAENEFVLAGRRWLPRPSPNPCRR